MANMNNTPWEGSIVRMKSSLVIPYLICNYDEYPLMTNSDKKMVEEYGLIELIPHSVPEYMYGIITQEHWAPPLWNKVEMFTIDWAAEYHLKLFDDTKNTNLMFWKYDVETVKWARDNDIDDNDEKLNKSFQYNSMYREWERREFVFKCWYCGEQGCDRMVVWDKLIMVYSDLTNNKTLTNKERRYTVNQVMLCWCNNMMENTALRDMCECVVKEVGELFPYISDECDDENESTSTIDLLE